MSKVVLFLGGAGSGKSRRAEQYAALEGRPVVYVATAEAGDDEMCERITRHQAQRPSQWRTIEAPRAVGAALRQLEPGGVILLDCLSLLASNVLFVHGTDPEATLKAEIDDLLVVVAENDHTLIVVTNEVGMALVPEYPLGRRYRDLLGRANQQIAAVAAETYLVVAGIPVELHALEAAFARSA